MGATFSPDRVYRYTLTREWDATAPQMCVIGLNPSTADETADDPTIRRCMGFARRYGCGSLVMTNLFAYRATDPRELRDVVDPVGPDNRANLLGSAVIALGTGGMVVAAWGAGGAYLGQSGELRALFAHMHIPLVCFGITLAGEPRHPLYLAAGTPLMMFGPARASASAEIG